MSYKDVVASLNTLLIKASTATETRIGMSEAIVAFLQVCSAPPFFLSYIGLFSNTLAPIKANSSLHPPRFSHHTHNITPGHGRHLC